MVECNTPVEYFLAYFCFNYVANWLFLFTQEKVFLSKFTFFVLLFFKIQEQ
ncbi:Uncharacterised protein [Escherichia coli]|nr:Uncharacterised protein [Escherichia coli]SQQ67590.1 Uncharacterised protein [Escherichia coli]